MAGAFTFSNKHLTPSTTPTIKTTGAAHRVNKRFVCMPRGIIKWFNNKKGFGFITDPSGEVPDIFVHYTAIRGDGFKTLEEGDPVEFDLADGERGPKALNVVKI